MTNPSRLGVVASGKPTLPLARDASSSLDPPIVWSESRPSTVIQSRSEASSLLKYTTRRASSPWAGENGHFPWVVSMQRAEESHHLVAEPVGRYARWCYVGQPLPRDTRPLSRSLPTIRWPSRIDRHSESLSAGDKNPFHATYVPLSRSLTHHLVAEPVVLAREHLAEGTRRSWGSKDRAPRRLLHRAAHPHTAVPP